MNVNRELLAFLRKQYPVGTRHPARLHAGSVCTGGGWYDGETGLY